MKTRLFHKPVFLIGCFLIVALPSRASSPGAVAVNHAPFIDRRTIDLPAVLPPPPASGSREARSDSSYIKFSGAAAPANQKLLAVAASRDSVFDYAQTLGPWFNPAVLPKTAALFAKVTDETNRAIDLAKNHYKRVRPVQWKETGDPEKGGGYCYPSGHTTRAYVWADLLSAAIPDERRALHLQARQKAWYRVVLGRHYPSDVRAGKTYGSYLAGQFLKSTAFEREWSGVCQEISTVRHEATPPSSFHP
jgi:acid phosphatase (class A)